MTTQEIIEKIRAEVERLKVDYLNRSYTFVPKAMQDLLDFISDLEKECEKSTTADGLEKEIERVCVSCPEKVKAESGLDKFTSKYCIYCSIEHCPGVKACYTSSNGHLQ